MIHADLHLHSGYSDGCHAVPRLLEIVHDRGITLASLTDHDTIAGVGEALQVGRELGLEIIPGLELAAGFQRTAAWQQEVHILAYGVNCRNSRLLELLEWNCAARRQRNREIFSRLHLLGLELDPQQLEQDEIPTGRLHIARLLVRSGQVKSLRRVFEDYLGDGRPAWRPRRLRSVAEVCATVTAADGLPVLAHPLKNLVFEELDQIAAMGLAGMETTHPAHNQATCRQLEDFSVTRGLFTTGGSDFHGPGPYQRPDFNPASLLAALRTARENATNEDTNVQ